MKKIITLSMLNILLVLLSIFASCSDDSKEKLEGSGISNASWSENTTYTISSGETLTFTFTAASNWTVQNSSTTMCSLSTNAGNSGKNTLKVTANSSSVKQATITIKVNGYSTPSYIKLTLTSGGNQDAKVNHAVDAYLSEKYLWNNDYKRLTPDFTLPYNEFLPNTLLSMTTNTLDKKPYIGTDGKTYYSLFSNIQKKNSFSEARSTTQVQKELQYSFGIHGVTIVYADATRTKYCFIVQGVYPGSSADQQGIKRGTQIYRANNKEITKSNIDDLFYSLIAPTSASSISLSDKEHTYKINSNPIYANPILHTSVKNNIGYLVYSSFDAAFDEELFNVFKDFKSKGVKDLILDLRYNGGGHVISADLISSCIVGNACQNKIFIQYRFNDERMQARNNEKEKFNFSYSAYRNLNNISLATGALNLNRLYCIVSKSTASASELVINSLRGINIPVTLIGETTHGKNVGMEVVDLNIDGSIYQLAPITFQSYNADNFGDYADGFTPTPGCEMDENNPKKDNFFYGYQDFGADNEPLYAKAVSLITGVNVPSAKVRSGDNKQILVNRPNLKVEKRIGMIKL